MRAKSHRFVTALYQSGASFISGLILGLWLERRHNASKAASVAANESYEATAHALHMAERYRDRGSKEAK